MAKGEAEASYKPTPVRTRAIHNSRKVCLLGHDTMWTVYIWKFGKILQ